MMATILLLGMGLSAQAQENGFKGERRKFDVAKIDSTMPTYVKRINAK